MVSVNQLNFILLELYSISSSSSYTKKFQHWLLAEKQLNAHSRMHFLSKIMVYNDQEHDELLQYHKELLYHHDEHLAQKEEWLDEGFKEQLKILYYIFYLSNCKTCYVNSFEKRKGRGFGRGGSTIFLRSHLCYTTQNHKESSREKESPCQHPHLLSHLIKLLAILQLLKPHISANLIIPIDSLIQAIHQESLV